MPLVGLKSLSGLQGLQGFGGGGGSFQPPNPVTAYLPGDEQIQRAQEEQQAENKRSLFWDILAAPEKILGQAVKGTIRGAAEDGVGGALEGLAHGGPWAWLSDAMGITDQFARETTFKDIRVAFGDTQDQSGAGNFIVNLAGDILLDPLTWVQPFGLVGEAAKAGRSVPGIKNAVELMQRAAVVWKFPGFSPIPISTNFGLKSMDLKIAEGLDKLGSFIRTNSVTGPVLRSFSARSPPIAGVAEAAQAVKAREALLDTHAAVDHAFLEVFATIPPEGQKAILNNPALQRVVFSARELGLTKYDEVHSLGTLLNEPAPVLNKIRFDKALKDDPHLAKLWAEANPANALSEGRGAAFDQLYRNYDFKLPDSWLEFYGVTPRGGIDIGLQDATKLATAEEIQAAANVGGQPLGAGEAARGATTASMAGAEASVRQGARRAAQADVQSVLDMVARGELKPEHFQAMLDYGQALMSRIGEAEIAKGILNSTFEYYVHRSVTPQAREALHEQFMGKIRDMGGDALNITAGFMKGRKFHDMLTIEVNALMRELGSKVTGYVPLKDLLEHGADAVGAKIFDLPFIKRLRKIDSPAADFFTTNPILADFNRLEQSKRVQGAHEFWATALHKDSVLVKDRVPLNDPAAIAQATARAEANGHAPFLLTANGKVQLPTQASINEQIVGKDVALRYQLQRDAIRGHTDRLLSTADADYSVIRKGLEDSILVDKGGDLKILDGDPLATVQMKRSLAEQDSLRQKIEESLAIEDEAKAYGYTDKFNIQQEITDELRSRLKNAKLNETSVREAVKAELAELTDLEKTAVSGITSNADRSKALLSALRHRGMNGQQMAEAVRLQRQFQADGITAWSSFSPEQQALMQKSMPDGELLFLDPKDAQGLVSYWKDQNKPDWIRSTSIGRWLADFTHLWSAWTVTNPIFLQTHTRNLATNTMMLLHGGARPWSPLLGGTGAFSDAWGISRAWQRHIAGNGDVLADLAKQTITRVGVTGQAESMTARQMLDFMGARGVVGSGLARDEVIQSAQSIVSLTGNTTVADIAKTFWRATPEKNALLKKGYQFASMGDDWGRMTGFIDAWKRGMDPEAALDWVRQWQYNPLRNTTSFERNLMKPVIPFYSWLKFAVTKSVDQFFEQPGTLTWLDKLKTNAQQSPPWGGGAIDPAKMETILPEFIRDGLGIPYKNTPDGPRYFLLGGYLPVAEIGKAADTLRAIFSSKPEDQNAFVRYWVGQMNPLLKETVEQVMNKDMFSNRPLADYPGQDGEVIGVPVDRRVRHVIMDARIINTIDKLNVINLDEMRAGINAVERGTVLGSRQELPFMDRVLGSAFGVTPKTYLVDASEDLRTARRTSENRIQDLTSRLKYALENKATQSNAENVKTLQELLADELANSRQMQAEAVEYNVPARVAQKRTLSLRSLSMRPQKPR